MNIWESVVIALENLRLNKMRSFLTIIGIVVGVAAVVTIVSIGQAAKSNIFSQFAKYDDAFFVVYPSYQQGMGQQEYNNLLPTTADLNAIARMREVKDAVGIVTYSMTSKNRKNEDTRFSITATYAELPKLENMEFLAGRFFNLSEERGRQSVVVLDQEYATDTFGSPEAALQKKINMNGKMYRIIGIFKVEKSLLSGFGGKRYSGYMPIDSIPSSIAGQGNKLDNIYVEAKSAQEVHQTIDAVIKLMTKRHNVDAKSYQAQTGKDTQQQVGTFFNVLQTIIGSIAGISLFVGGIGVMNIMLVSVTERTREIGIRKAIGATPGNIMGQFLIEAVILSFFGGVVGAVLGTLGAYIFSLFTKWPFIISGWAVALAFIFSAIVGIFFGLYPANRAARLQPIESLRYE